jgi:hypothetical protein
VKPQRRSIGNISLESLRLLAENHARVIGGQISFGATMGNAEQDRNIQCSKASGVTPGVANTEFAVPHGLGRVPITLNGWDTNNGGVIYRSTTAWTKTQAFFKCTTASATYNLILV